MEEQGAAGLSAAHIVADALIASTYLAGTNTRRVRRALGALFGGAVGKDTVSRVWRKVKGDWDAWNARSLADEPIVRLILDGTVVRVRLDRKATAISLLVVIGVRADGQKMLIAIKSMGGESTEAWRAVLDDLIKSVAQRSDHQRHRATARGVQATDQDADRSAIGRHCRHAVLGVARLRPDQHAQGRRLANARYPAH